MGIFEKSDAARKEKENLKREKQELIRLKKEYAENEKTIARLQKKLDKKEKEHFALQTKEIKRRIERAPAPDESLWEVDGSGALRSLFGFGAQPSLKARMARASSARRSSMDS